MNPLELLDESEGLPRFDLPGGLERLYGGTLGFHEPRLYANFVATIDGVVAIPSVPQSNKLIAGGSAADRFLMGLLRACADVVLLGSGTLQASPGGLWTPDQAFPDGTDDFAELRRRIGRPPGVEVAVLSASGALDATHPALARGALVLTTDEGAAALAADLPPGQVVSLGPGPELDAGAAVALLRERGHRLILSESGPRVFASLLEARLVDELFLTVSPLLAGRVFGGDRLGLAEGADLLGETGLAGARVLGVRRSAEHLFLRYELTRS
jgi:riboflavin biosynthesis pyrimidine reductase